MAAFAQLRLLLHKNWTLRRRQPVILSLELLWPVVVILIAVAIRYAIPPTPKEDCYYKARAQPSAGLLPFIQSYVCTINNTCDDASSYEEIPAYPESYLNKMLPQVIPLFKNPEVMELIERFPASLKLGRAIVDAILEPDIRKILGSDVQLQDFFQDPKILKSRLLTGHHMMSSYATEALLRSKLNFPKILSGVSSWSEPGFWVCSSTSFQRWLILPEVADAGHVSSEVCSAIKRQDFLRTLMPILLQEFNWLASAEKIQALLRSFNSPNEGNGIARIIRMVETVVNRKELLEMADKLENVKAVTRLIPLLVKLFDPLTDINFDFLRTVVADISMVTNNHNMSLHLGRIVNVTEMVWNWIRHDEATITFDRPIPLGSVLENRAEVEGFFNQNLGLSKEESNAILSADVSPDVLEGLIGSGGDATQIFCTSSDAVLEGDVQHPSLLVTANQHLHKVLCSDENVQRQLKSRPDLFRLTSEGRNDHLSSANLMKNFDELEGSLRYVSNTFLAKINGSLPQFDIIWKLTAAVVHVLLRNDWTHHSLNNQTLLSLVPILDVIPAVLPQHFHQNLAQGFVSAHFFITLANNITRITRESDSLLVDDIRSHIPVIRRLLRLGPDAVWSLYTLLSNDTKLTQLIDSSERLDKIFCNPAKLRELFTGDSTNTSLLLAALCKPGIASFLEGLSRGMGVSSAARQIEEAIAEFRNSTTQKFYDVSLKNFTTLAVQAQELLNYITSDVSGGRNKWRQLLRDLGSNFHDERWHKVWLKFDAESIPVLTSVYIRLLQKQLRESSTYDEITKAVLMLTRTLRPLLDGLKTISSDLKVNHSIYWPYAIETFLRTLQDNTKFQRLLRVEDWSNVTCTRSSFWEVLVIPLSVNANELQRFLCNVTTSFQQLGLPEKWAEILQLKGSRIATNNEDYSEEIVWRNLTNQVRYLYESYRQLIVESRKEQYDLHELLRQTRNTFTNMPQAKRAQLGLVVLLEGLDLTDIGMQQGNYRVSKTWNGFRDLMQHLTLLLNILNEKWNTIVTSKQIVVDDITSSLPHLSEMLRRALRISAPMIEVVSQTILTNPHKLLARVFQFKDWLHVPCERRSLVNFFDFPVEVENDIRHFESELCRYHSKNMKEFYRHPFIRAIMNKPDSNITSNKTSSLQWRSLANTILDLQTIWEKGFIENLKLFPDVGNFSLDGVQKAMALARNLSHIRNRDQLRMLLSGTDVIASFLVNISREVGEKSSTYQFIYVLLKSIGTMDIIFDEIGHTIQQVIDGQTDIISLLGSDVDQLTFAVLENLDTYLYAALASITDHSFPIKLQRLLPSGREFSYQEFCDNVGELDEFLSVPAVKKTNISSIVASMCQRNFSAQVYSLSKIHSLVEEIRHLWNSKLQLSNDLITDFAFSWRNVTDKIIKVQHLSPRPVLQWGLSNNTFSRTKWGKFEADVVDLLSREKQDGNDFVLQRSESALSFAVSFLSREPRLVTSLETISGVLRMLSIVSKAAMANEGINVTADLSKQLFQNTSDDWIQAAKWFQEHGLEFVDAILNTAIENPEKMILLLGHTAPWKEWCNGNLSFHLTFPPNSIGNETAKQEMCNIPWDKLPQQLRQIGCQVERNATAFATCFTSSYAEFYSSLQDLYKSNASAVILRSKLTTWKDVIIRRYRQYFKSNRTADPSFWLRKITDVFDSALQTSGLGRWIVATQHILNWLNTKLKLLEVTQFDVTSIIANYPEIRKVWHILDQHGLPFTESWILTIYSHPDKIATLLRRPDKEFCNTTLSDVLVVHNSSLTPDLLRDDICQLNSSLLVDDLLAFLDWRSLKAAVAIPTGNARSTTCGTVNSTMAAIERMTDNLRALYRLRSTEVNIPDWLNVTSWKNMAERIHNNFLRQPRLAGSAIYLLAYTLEQEGYGTILSIAQSWMDLSNNRTKKIIQSGDDIGIESLFTGFPELQQIVGQAFLNLPAFVKIYLKFERDYSAEYQELQTLKSWDSFCNSSIQAKMLERFNETKSGQAWLEHLCTTNMTHFQKELGDFLAVDFYIRVDSRLSNGSSHFDTTKLVMSATEFMKNIHVIANSSRLQQELKYIFNETVWIAMFKEAYNMSGFLQRLNGSIGNEDIGKFLTVLQNSSIVSRPMIVQRVFALQKLITWLTLKLNFLAGTYPKEAFPTLEKVITIVNGSLLKLVEESGNLLLTYSQLPELLGGNFSPFCSMNSSQDHETNTTSLHFLLCNIDYKALHQELRTLIDRDDLVAAFKRLTSESFISPVPVPLNVTLLYRDVTNFKEVVNLLLHNGIRLPPTRSWFNPAAWQNVWNSISSTANNTLHQGPTLWARWLNVPLARLQNTPEAAPIIPVLKKLGGVVEWLQQLSTNLPTRDNTSWSDILSRFTNADTILQIISNHAVEVVEALVKTAIDDPQELTNLFQEDSRRALTMLCTNRNLSIFSELRFKPVIDKVCTLDLPAMADDVKKLIAWPTLYSIVRTNYSATPPVNSSFLLYTTERLQKIIWSLQHADLHQPFLNLSSDWRNKSGWQDMADRLREEITSTNFSRVSVQNWLPVILHSVLRKGGTFQRETEQTLISASIFVKLTSNIGKMLLASSSATSTEVMKTLYVGRADVQLLIRVLDNLPDVLSIVIATFMHPKKAFNLLPGSHPQETWHSRICTKNPQDHFVLPPEVKEESMNILFNFICTSNLTELFVHLDPMQTVDIIKMLQQPFNEVKFMQDVDELLSVIDGIIMKTKDVGKDGETLRKLWQPFLTRIENLNHLMTSADWASLKTALVIVGPTLESWPRYTRPVYHRMLAVLHEINTQLEAVLNTTKAESNATQFDFGATSLNLTTATKVVLWWSGCKVEQLTDELNNNCTDADIRNKLFWGRESDFSSPCIPFNFKEIFENVGDAKKVHQLASDPIPWETVAGEIQDIVSTFWSMSGHSQNSASTTLKWQCDSFDVRKSLQRLFYTVLSSFPRRSELRDVRNALAAVFSIFEVFPSYKDTKSAVPLYTFVRNQSAFEHYLLKDVGLPTHVARSLPFHTLINANDDGWKLVHDNSNVCADRRMWARAVSSKDGTYDQYLRKVFCASKPVSPYFDTNKVVRLGGKENSYEFKVTNDTAVHNTIFENRMVRNRMIESAFLVLRLLDRVEGWQLFRGLLQPANYYLTHALSYTENFTGSGLNWYHLLTNVTLFMDFLDYATNMPKDAFDYDKTIITHFTNHPDEAQEFCKDSPLKLTAASLIKSELGPGVGNVTALFEILCKVDPERLTEVMTQEAGIPKYKIKAVFGNLMMMLPENATWNQNQRQTDRDLDWNELRMNVYKFADMMEGMPSQFIPGFEWAFWKPFFVDSLPSVVPNIAKIVGLRTCSIIEHRSSIQDFSLATIIFHIISNQVQGLPGLQSIACELPNMHLPALYDQLMQYGGVMETIQGIYNITTHVSQNYTCPEMVEWLGDSTEQVLFYINYYQQPKHVRRMDECYLRIGQTTAFAELDRYLQLFMNGLDLVQKLSTEYIRDENGTTSSLSLSSIVRSVQDAVEVLHSQSSVFVPLRSVQNIDKRLPRELSTKGHLEPRIINALMDSEINLSKLNSINFSIPEMAKIICNQREFYKVIRLENENEVTYYELRRTLCDSNITAIAAVIISSLYQSGIASQIPALDETTFFKWKSILAVGNHVDDIFHDLFVLSNVAKKLKFDERFTKITVAESVIGMLHDNSLQTLIDGTTSLRTYLQPLIENTDLDVDIETIITGLKSLHDITNEELIPLNYNVEKFFANFTLIASSLSKVFGLSHNDIVAFGQSNLTLNGLFRTQRPFTTFKDVLCDTRQLASVLSVPNVNLLVTLERSLCDRNDSSVDSFITLCADNINFYVIFREVFLSGLRKVGQTAHLNNDEVDNTIKVLPKLGQLLPNITALLRTLHSMEALSDLLDEFQNTADLMQLQDPNMSLTSLNQTHSPRALRQSQSPAANLNDYVPSLLKVTGNIFCGKPLRNFLDDFSIIPDTHVNSLTTQDQEVMKELPTRFCKNLFTQILQMKAGPVIWGYLKPLMRGKILYAPITPLTKKIMRQANVTLELLATFSQQLNQWSSGTDTLRTFDQTRLQEFQTVLNLTLVREVMQQFAGKDLSLLSSDLSALLQEVHRFDKVLSLVEVLAEAMQCFSLNRYIGLPSEMELERTAQELYAKDLFMGGVVFLNAESTRHTRSTNEGASRKMPSEIAYKIRMDIDNVPSTKRLKQWFWRPGPEDNFANDLRYFRGFVQIQEILDLAIIQMQTGDDVLLPSTYTQQFPYPCFLDDDFGFFMKGLVPLITTLAMIFLIAFFVRERVLERELSLEQTMQMMGLRSGIHWCAWFISCLVVMIIVVTCFVVALRFGGILPRSNIAILYLFILDYAFAVIMFCYMMSVFFNSATIAALTSVIVFIISYLPFVIILTLEAELVFWQKMLSNAVMSTAFSYGCLYIARYEEQNVGIQWDSAWTSPIADDDFSFAWSCIMLLCDGVVYFLVGVVISHTTSGNCYLWNLICCRTTGKSMTSYGQKNSKRNRSSVHLAFCENDYMNENHLSSLAQLQLSDSKKTETVGISLNCLHKVFDQGSTKAKTAIDQLSLDFYENQITTLLGQNGAGKTTTIHLLTGMLSPTSGFSLINGQDVQKNFSNIRKNLGVCPQKNILFPLFTVREHLEFYSKLKGTFVAKQICCDVDRMLDSMNLSHKQDELVCNLSDGTRRRLCVAIAFIGGSRTIILDEPTSGVDPVARRKIWDLIVAHKNGRTILLTTHHLDEADILSDRVAILHQGKLLCCGSPHFLKTQFGSGYQVTVMKRTCDSDSDSDSGAGSFTSSSSANVYDSSVLLTYLRRFVPNARLLEDHGSEVVFSLPYFTDQGLPNKYDVLFSDMEENQMTLGIGSYGLSCATLEEVFLTVCAEADAGYPITPRDPKNWMFLDNPQTLNRHPDMLLNRRRSSKILLKDLRFESEDWNKDKRPARNDRYLSGCSLKIQQMSALLKKRSSHAFRDWSGLCSTILLPCIFVAIAMGFSLLRSVGHQNDDALQLTPSLYGPGAYSFVSLESEAPESFNHLVEGLFGNSTHSFSEPTSGTAGHYKWVVNSWSDRKCSCFAQDKSCYEKPAASLVVQYLVQNETNFIFNLSGINVSQWILNTNEEFHEKRYGGLTFGSNSKHSEVEETGNEFVKVWYNNKGYHALPSYLNTLHNSFLRANVNISADNSQTLKITTYNHPLVLSGEQLSKESIMEHIADVGVAIVFVVAFSFIPASFIVFVVQERVREEKRLQFVSGVTPFLYWSATYFWNLVLAAVTVGLAIAIIAAIGLSTYVAQLNLPALAALFFLYCWATTPLMYILEKLFVESSLASMVLFCVNVFIGVNTMVCTLLLSLFQTPLVSSTVLPIIQLVFLIFPQFAFGGALVELAKNSIQAEIFARFGRNTYSNPFNLDITGIHMIVLAVQGLVFFVVNFLLEYRCGMCCSRKSKVSTDILISEDTDVLLERKRVAEEPNNDLLRLNNLTKVYSGRSLAVDSICLGIPRGECFGLLGVNGAGKTTTFRMMTGQLKPTSGTVQFKRHSISHTLGGESRAIGFCPQANALDDLLTAEELLRIYGKFRGVPSSILPQVVHRLIEKFHLQAFAKRRTNSFSLGMKRKLCVAISVLGNPELVLMDEPTSGMDPSSRRHVWTNILQIMKDKRSVILTSHSMEECDNLCSRIAIMVNGRFQCLGGPQYLKHKFGEGYTLKLRVHEDVLDWGHIISFIHDHFPLAILKARHCNTIEFLVPTTHVTLSQIFSCMENQKDVLGVEDFSVSQTTLDQVFVNFVRQQSDGADDNADKQSRFGRRSRSLTPIHSYTNSSCSLDDEGLHSNQRITVQLASRRTPTLSRYNDEDYDTTKF